MTVDTANLTLKYALEIAFFFFLQKAASKVTRDLGNFHENCNKEDTAGERMGKAGGIAGRKLKRLRHS